MNTAPSTAKQIAYSPYAQQGIKTGAKYAAKEFLPKSAGWKAASGLKGGAIGIGGSVAANYLKPKAEAVMTGGPEFGHITDKYRRREEGPGSGIAANAVDWASKGAQYGGWYGAAIGGAAGAIRGAATKKAKSAFSDFRPDDTRTIFGDAYREYLGRDPEAGAYEGWMSGQGFRPGDKGVGQKHMFEKLAEIKNSPEAQMKRGNIPGGGINTAPTQMPAFTPQPTPSSFLSPEQVAMLDEARKQQLGY